MEENTTLLDKIAAVLDLGKEKGIAGVLEQKELGFEGKAAPLLSQIAAEMKVTPVQAALFAFIFDVSFLSQDDFRHSDRTSLLETLKCSKVAYLKYLNEIDELVKLAYVDKIIDSHDFPRFAVPRNIILSLRRNETLKPKSITNLSLREFLAELQNIFRCRYNDEMPYGEMCERLEALVQNNPNLDLLKKIASYEGINEDNRNLLLYICNKTASRDGSRFSPPGVVHIEAIRKHFEDPDEEFDVEAVFINPLQREEHCLQEMKIIENNNDDGMACPEEFVLTRKARKELLPELKGSRRRRNDGDLIKASDLKEKAMFYNKKDGEAIEKLASLLDPGRYKEVIKSLADKGMRSGFACLFSGAPGTGKTETVFQIARRTGRDLLKVDISAVKSCWVGESEKNIKEIFTHYREVAEERAIEPILFFNEADAVIGKRQEFNSSSHAVDRMENTMQNIILEEIENLQGILIATTNLSTNLDKAFERRFLYKIEFGKPGEEVRKNLWLAMFPGIREEDAARLAARFDFSGGQIENIVRKRYVDLVIEGREPGYDALVEYCEDELMEKVGRRVGFVG